jgi:hypothetical protein
MELCMLKLALLRWRVGRPEPVSRRKLLKRWRIIGMEAATMVKAGSAKPQQTSGRELSIGA